MSFMQFAMSRRSGAQPVLKRRLFRYAWMVLALAGGAGARFSVFARGANDANASRMHQAARGHESGGDGWRGGDGRFVAVGRTAPDTSDVHVDAA